VRGLLLAQICTEAYTSDIGLDINERSISIGLRYSVFEAMFRRAGVVKRSLRTGGSVDPSTEVTRTKKGMLSREDGTNEYVN